MGVNLGGAAPRRVMANIGDRIKNWSLSARQRCANDKIDGHTQEIVVMKENLCATSNELAETKFELQSALTRLDDMTKKVAGVASVLLCVLLCFAKAVSDRPRLMSTQLTDRFEGCLNQRSKRCGRETRTDAGTSRSNGFRGGSSEKPSGIQVTELGSGLDLTREYWQGLSKGLHLSSSRSDAVHTCQT